MINALLARPRRIIATLALILAATGVAVGSGASFTSSSTTAASTFATGTLTQSNDRANTAILSATNMKPGDTTTGTVTVTNTGSLATTFKVVQSAYSGAFETPLQLNVVDDKGTKAVYNGNLSDFGTRDLEGVVAAGTSHKLTFTVSFPRTDADQNADQNKKASATFSFVGAQTEGRDLTTSNTNGTN